MRGYHWIVVIMVMLHLPLQARAGHRYWMMTAVGAAMTQQQLNLEEDVITHQASLTPISLSDIGARPLPLFIPAAPLTVGQQWAWDFSLRLADDHLVHVIGDAKVLAQRTQHYGQVYQITAQLRGSQDAQCQLNVTAHVRDKSPQLLNEIVDMTCSGHTVRFALTLLPQELP